MLLKNWLPAEIDSECTETLSELRQQGLQQATFIRMGWIIFLAIWVLTQSSSKTAFIYESTVLLTLIGLAIGYHFLCQSHRWRTFHAYILVILEAILLSAILIYQPNPEAGSVIVNLNGQGFLYFMVLLGSSAFSYSARLLLWTCISSLIIWHISLLALAAPSYIVTIATVPSEMGLLIDSNTSYMTVWLQQTVLMLLLGVALSFIMNQIVHLLCKQIRAEREFYTILIRDRLNTGDYANSEDSYTDELTGLGTQLAFQRDSAQFTKVFTEGRLSDLTIAFIDLEGLETLREQEGEEHYQQALLAFAELSREQYRSSDMLYILGNGAHFALLAPGATSNNSDRLHSFLNNIMHKLEKRGFHNIKAQMGLSTLNDTQNIDEKTPPAKENT